MTNPFYIYEGEGLSPISEGDFTELEEFTLLKSIGRGSFAEVFLGRENRSGKEYAIKVNKRKNA